MHRLKNFIFLTGSEILIQNNTHLTVHLGLKDSRVEAINNNRENLYFVVYNPSVKWVGTFQREKWYLIPKPRYTGSTTSKKVYHFSFDWRYKLNVGFGQQRLLTNSEVDFFRENNYLKLDFI